jgi:flagellar motor switch/type III secretory pathway protein FliN
MPEDPMLSQEEIDALLRSMSGAVDVAQPQAVPPAPAQPAYVPSRAPAPVFRGQLPRGMELLLDVDVTCSVDLGVTEIEFGDLLSLRRSSLLVLDGVLSEPFVLRVNGVPFARGTIVETDGRYGLQISELARPQEEEQAS